MRIFTRCCYGVGILAVGYVLGACGAFDAAGLQAQPQPPADAGPSEETIDKIREADNAVNSAMLALKNDGRYSSVTQAPNAFAIMAGGLNALADLESGRGVDPITFAGLYADQANGDIKENLTHDDEGRLLYKGKLVRMYSIGRLKQMYAVRAQILGEEEE
ncbi:MAG: hypothetical protein HON53_14885 [Planctomycetaceae bacterium]|jgi:hypothetical protein|nr:hypothetical protein [Planctomycetaceae bacterium]MBT6156515.1 hypothetical protein [Planctomycetaceae bacterium]MBT6485407.1 hypothetical protein [Planctomycetaceae bacterium]MBT6497203.1 hypothetical protein [Planctomycetaceae bacterium]